MKIGLKRTFFPLRMFFPIIAVAIIATLIYGSYFKSSNEAAAQIAVLYSSTCLGGWKNPDHAVGIPEVIGDSEATYSDENSATLTNTMTQLFCAGFSGDIPKEADRTKISVRFSWQMESHEAFQKERLDSNGSDYRTEVITVTESASSSDGASFVGSTTESVPTDASVSNTDTPQEPAVEEQPTEAEPVVEEPTIEPETVSWWQWLVPFAYAQEENVAPEETEEQAKPVIEESIVVPKIVVEGDAVASSSQSIESPIASSTDSLISSSTSASSSVSYSFISPVFDQNKDKDNALFEVLFTIDNVQWHSLGYVSRINNDISFDIPVELFPNVEDFNKLQISLESVQRIDDTPKIYLDSMWVEVSYVGVGEDPLSPPGSLPGDVITNTYTADSHELVTVFRNVGLDTISNILMITASTSTSTTATTSTSSSTASTAKIASSTIVAAGTSTGTTTATSSITIYDAPISLETKNILRETPGVLVELWLHNLTEDTWMRVVDNTSVATVPRAVLIETKVFWFGPYNSSVWVFDSLSQGYASQSITPQERVAVDFVDSAGIAQTVWFNPETQMLELLVSDE
jgi:hypothetical protein